MNTPVATDAAAYPFKMAEVLETASAEVVETQALLRRPLEQLLPLRNDIRKALQTGAPRYRCPYCKTPVILRWGEQVAPHFAHLPKGADVDCLLCDDDRLTIQARHMQRYNAQKERTPHRRLQSDLHEVLRGDKQVKKVLQHTYAPDAPTPAAWREADFSCTFRGRKLALEVCTSNQYLNDAAARDRAYRAAGQHVVWVFDSLESCRPRNDAYAPDAFYHQPETNLFVLDPAAREAAHRQRRLQLRCYYRVPQLHPLTGHIAWRWRSRLVGLDDFIFNAEDYRTYVVDYPEQHHKAEQHRELLGTSAVPGGLLHGGIEIAYEFDRDGEFLVLLDEDLGSPLTVSTDDDFRIRLEDGRPVDPAQLRPEQNLNLLFGAGYQSRNLANLRRQLQELRAIGFAYPENYLEQLERQGFIRPLAGKLSQVHYERVGG